MFTTTDKLKASSICHIFETSKPLGNSTTVAVLNDRAGISYGIPQATHKSGNLLDVIERYIASSDEVLYEPLFRKHLPALRKNDQRTVDKTAENDELKRALREAGNEPEMRKAQLDNINDRMQLAIRACAGSGFKLPLSLAVVYDSMNHGSWAKIRDSIKISDSNEKAWITAYIKTRHNWLKSITRLNVTSYRTKFYLDQIATDNWDLDLPVVAHGFKLTDKHINAAEKELQEILLIPGVNTAAHEIEQPKETEEIKQEINEQPPGTVIQKAEQIINTGDQSNDPAPKDETIVAPDKDGASSIATKNTILGFTAPPAIWAIYQAITDLVEKGYIDMKEIANGGFQLLRENYKYVLLLVGLLICLLMLKKLFKQITFWIQMVSKMVPNFNNLNVKPGSSVPPSKWWEIWK